MTFSRSASLDSSLSQAVEPDWGDLRIFLHVADHGTAKAALRFSMDITTIRRRVAALERSIGAPLLMKNGRSFCLTAEGIRVRAVAAEMEDLGGELRRGNTDAVRELDAVVRVSTMDGFGSAYLAPRIPEFLVKNPRIFVQLVTAPHIFNLAEREADLSINMVRPQSGRFVVRKLAPFGVGLYGAKDYLIRYGEPSTRYDLGTHSFVSYVDELIAIPNVRWLPEVLESRQSRLACTSLTAQKMAVSAGAGLAMLPHFMAQAAPELKRVLHADVHLVCDWWLVVHEDLQFVPRIRALIDFVVSTMAADRELLVGN